MPRRFYTRDARELAPLLLNKILVTGAGTTRVAARIVEVEAYAGSEDAASHAFRGPTARNQTMFGAPGHLYVYFTYGMHWCANLVCGSAGVASAVLMRAGQVVDGLEMARSRRVGVSDRDLARGPARLAMALALGRDHNGIDTVVSHSSLVLRGPAARSPRLSSESPAATVASGPRVGVSGPGGDGALFPWRFWLEGEATVSTYRRAVVRLAKPAAGSGAQ